MVEIGKIVEIGNSDIASCVFLNLLLVNFHPGMVSRCTCTSKCTTSFRIYHYLLMA